VVDTGGNLPPASLTPAANLPSVSLTPVARCQQHKGDWWQKFTAGVVDTGCKFAAGVVGTGGNLPPVSLTLVVSNGKTSIVHYRTLSFFAIRF
jgi:hypothetical protein